MATHPSARIELLFQTRTSTGHAPSACIVTGAGEWKGPSWQNRGNVRNKEYQTSQIKRSSRLPRSASASEGCAHVPQLLLNKILRQDSGEHVSQDETPFSDLDANEISANTNRILILYHFNSYKTRPITGKHCTSTHQCVFQRGLKYTQPSPSGMKYLGRHGVRRVSRFLSSVLCFSSRRRFCSVAASMSPSLR